VVFRKRRKESTKQKLTTGKFKLSNYKAFMAKAKNKNGKQELSGTGQAAANPYAQAGKDGGLMLIAAILASGAGAAIGKHSFFAGLPLTFLGVYKKNPYIIAAGIGLTISNGFQIPATAATTQTTTEGIDGFDIKKIATDAKNRVGTFFDNFKEKLYLPKSKPSETTEGLGDDQVTYFVNPYNNKELDMSAIDRVQEQIAQMNKSGTSGLNEVDREF
jgi:hypothetical protein